MTGKTAIEIGSSAHDVLRLLFTHGPQSQSEIAERLAITKAACNQHFRRLVEDGLIEPGEELSNQRGRPSQLWRLRIEGNYFMGILFYDSTLTVTVIDFAGAEVGRETAEFTVATPRDALLELLLALVERGCRLIRNRKGRILQCFAAAGGLIAPDGTIIRVSQSPGLNGVNLEQVIEENFGLRCYADTTHYAYIQSETRDLPPATTTLILDWGDGIGGILTSGNEVLSWSALPSLRNRGLWNLGHVPVVKGGELCQCGQRGCLEAYVGGRALAHRRGLAESCGDRELTELIRNGDEKALTLLQEGAQRIAAAMYWTLELFGVDTVIFIGGFAEFFDRFAAAFRAGLEEMRTPEEAARIQLRTSCEPKTGMGHGAALMARQVYFFPDAPRTSRGVYRPEINATGTETR